MSQRNRPDAYADFEDFGTQLARFQGGVVILHGYGCHACGRGLWVEDNDGKLDPPSLSCPSCRAVPRGAPGGVVLVRVAPEILSQLIDGGSEPVHVLGVTDNGDGTHDMVLRTPEVGT